MQDIRAVRDKLPRADKPLRVIVADDHACVRLGVANLLHATARAVVVGEAGDALALAKQLDTTACDVVVSDLCMPGLDGEFSSLALLRRLVRAQGEPAVVVLTMVSTPQVLTGLLHQGLDVLVDKRDVVHDLLLAVAAAHARAPYLSGHARDSLERAGAACAPCAGVPSAREWEVFQLYVQGMSVRQIAHRFQRSNKTISAQKRSTMRKLGLVTERDVVDFATQVGLT
ncbi:response regulator transcription factor [Paraburkholderia lycopersici]|uniref:Two-component system, NarL family, captular synthesis response regulator RcsB n=1 Tax=Paraburkholderia lycopersici TaxID=416944 RepID=A0A1G6GS29_9BURK|nr:response regulator transcription factor [Paraburkholderia lycopersici]SDB84778.1 two-component system, NarL family, captular synthesis response regulator RcsB [Paraburkholderia lycopersici]